MCDDQGTCFHNVSSENIVANDKILGFREKVPEPTWHQLSLGGKSAGEILISSQLCPLVDKNEVLTRPPASFLEPKTMKVLLEVFVLGLRDMKGRFGGRPTKPFLRFCIGEKTLETAPSGKPNRRNPNYLVRIQEVVELPTEQIFMPTLRMEAVDSLLGGRIKQIIAAHELPLENKTDWTQSRAGWVQQYFEDKAFDLMDPKKGERMDSVKINQRINRVGLFFNDFLDALSKYEADLDAHLADERKRASTGATAATTPLIELLDEMKEEDEAKKAEEDKAMLEQEQKEQDEEERMRIKKRNDFLTLAKKISERKVVNDDRILKIAETYVRVRNFVEDFDFAANKLENQSPSPTNRSLTRERFSSKLPDDDVKESNEILENFPALVMISAESDDKGGYWRNLKSKKKFVPDIVKGPRYVGFGHAPSLFCKSLVPAFDWSKRNSGEIPSEDVAVKSKGWTKVWDNGSSARNQIATVAAWMPVAPENYVAMGLSFTSGPDCLRHPQNAVLCLKKSLSSEVKIKECPLVWTDARM